MGRNLESPFIPSDAGSRLGFGFFSNSFMSARSFLSDSAGFASGAPIGGESPHARPQYRGRFCGKSRELALNDRSHPSNSYELSLPPPPAAPTPLTVSNTLFSGSVPHSREHRAPRGSLPARPCNSFGASSVPRPVDSGNAAYPMRWPLTSSHPLDRTDKKHPKSAEGRTKICRGRAYNYGYALARRTRRHRARPRPRARGWARPRAGRHPSGGFARGAGHAGSRARVGGSRRARHAADLRHAPPVQGRLAPRGAGAAHPVASLARRPRLVVPAPRGCTLPRRDAADVGPDRGEPRASALSRRAPPAVGESRGAPAVARSAGRRQGREGAGSPYRPDPPQSPLCAAPHRARPPGDVHRPRDHGLRRRGPLGGHGRVPGRIGAALTPGARGQSRLLGWGTANEPRAVGRAGRRRALGRRDRCPPSRSLRADRGAA